MALSALRSICLSLALAQCTGLARNLAAQSPSPTNADPAELDRLRSLALQEGESGKTEDAIRDYQRILSQQPDWKEGTWNLGMLQYTAGHFRDAQLTFAKVTAFAPSLGTAWALLGLAEFENASYDDALTHLQTAQTLGVKDDGEIARVSVYHLGLLYIRAGQFDRATQLLSSSFGTGSPSPQATIAVGLANLRVPLLPAQLDPSREALIAAAGEAAIANDPARFAALLQAHPDIPYIRLCYCRSLAAAGKTAEALQQCLTETTVSPRSPFPWIEASRLQLLQGAPSASLKSAQEAVRVSPDSTEAHAALAQAYQASGHIDLAGKEQQFATAHPLVASAPEQRIVRLYLNPNSTAVPADRANEDRFKQALRSYVAADYPAAAADLKAWLASNPTSGTGWALLGLCEFALKDYDSALIHLDRSAKLGMSASSQSIDEARSTYGILLVRAGRFDEAQTVLATAWHPDGPLTQRVEFTAGLALLQRAQFPESVVPADVPLITAAGHIAILLEKSKYEDAFPQFKTLLAQYPAVPFLHYAYGTALIALSEFDQAAAEMQAERTISPRSELPCLRLASISLRQHDPAPAVRWAQCALELSHDSIDAHYLMGRASLETGDVPAAIRELEIAAALSPASPEIHFNLAKAYAKAKMTDKAQRERETFSRLNEAQKSPTPTPAQR